MRVAVQEGIFNIEWGSLLQNSSLLENNRFKYDRMISRTYYVLAYHKMYVCKHTDIDMYALHLFTSKSVPVVVVQSTYHQIVKLNSWQLDVGLRLQFFDRFSSAGHAVSRWSKLVWICARAVDDSLWLRHQSKRLVGTNQFGREKVKMHTLQYCRVSIFHCYNYPTGIVLVEMHRRFMDGLIFQSNSKRCPSRSTVLQHEK